MKKIVFALLVASLSVPAAAEAASPARKGKAATTKAVHAPKKAAPKRVVKGAKPAKAAVHRAKATRTTRPEPAQPLLAESGPLEVKSSAALVIEQGQGRTLYAKNIDAVVPIASITKLMTAMVVLDAALDLREAVEITDEDVDRLKNTRSRLALGTVLERDELLRLALMSSENRAASALGRSYPGGLRSFVAAMNNKAFDLGMRNTHFVDSTGLSSENVSSAQDLAKMVTAAYRYPLIPDYTTLSGHVVRTSSGRMLSFGNSNGLVKDDKWHIGVSKTGYISEAGRCLVMQARIAAQPVIIILLDSWGKYTRIGDANRIKRWVETAHATPAPG